MRVVYMHPLLFDGTRGTCTIIMFGADGEFVES
jgi:hypothetical protein